MTGMSAKASITQKLMYAKQRRISRRIIEETLDVNRVTYDVRSKLPATPNWK
jgi:GMP synthase PP-ATPase subunit